MWARAAGCFTLVALLIGTAAELQWQRERRYPLAPPSEDTPYLLSGRTTRRLAVGYAAVAGDLYWIRAIQYYGGTKIRLGALSQEPEPVSGRQASAYPALYPLLDLTTTLDPRFNIAYRFGAIFLAEPFPGGAGRPDHAIALLQKGLGARPDKWEYMQDIGFVHYWWRRDYRAAAEWFERASRVPGAPWFLRSLAATTLAEGGDRQSSRIMWTSILQSAEIDWLRREAERRLLQLRAMDETDMLQKAIDRVAAQSGRPVADWESVSRAGAPLDPSGAPYEIRDGRIGVSPKSILFPLPEEPQRLGTPAP